MTDDVRANDRVAASGAGAVDVGAARAASGGTAVPVVAGVAAAAESGTVTGLAVGTAPTSTSSAAKPDTASLVVAAGARLRPLWYLGVLGCLAAAINTTYFGEFSTAPLFLGLLAFILDHLNGHAVHEPGAPALSPGVRWGQVGWYFTLAAVMRGSWWLAAPLLLASASLGGWSPLLVWWHVVRRQVFSIRGERWVDFVALLLMSIGAFFLLIGLALGLGVSFSRGNVEWGALGPLGIGLPPMILGIGIRRRALWAGVLGLCFTFWGFASRLINMFAATNGDITRLPAAFLSHGLDLVLWWLFFFGFYSVFYPLLSAWAGHSGGHGLADQLKDADAALANTKARLDDAEGRAQRTTRDLEEERLRLEAMFESINEGVALIDPDEKVTYLNPAMCEFYGIDREAWLGRTWEGVCALPGVQCLGRREVEMTVRMRGVDRQLRRVGEGEVALLDTRGNPRRRLAYYTKVVTAPDGECLAFMNLSRDVTVAREIEQMKTEFVSNVSHELRTPLTSIRAYTEMLIDGESADAATDREYLGIVLSESERLTNLINNILDLSKMEAGKKEYRFARHRVRQLIERATAVAMPAAEKKRHQLLVEFPAGSEELEVVCDPDLLHQALLNLLNNAVKYTPADGHVTVRFRLAGDRYRLVVADDGPGISRDDQKKLFTKFFRVENSLSREIGGTGLGLAMVRHIATVHQGEVSIESEPGRGSTFALDLPVAPVIAPAGGTAKEKESRTGT